MVLALLLSFQAGIVSQPYFWGRANPCASFSIPTTNLIFWGETITNLFGTDHSTPLTNDITEIKCWSSRVTNLVADPSLTNQPANGSNHGTSSGPTYRTSGGPANRPYIGCEGNKTLWNGASHNWNQSNKVTIICLVKSDNVNGNGETPEVYDGVNGQRFFLDRGLNVPVSTWEAYAGSFVSGTSFTITNWTVWTVGFAGANSFVRTNGVLAATGNTGSPGNYAGVTIAGNPVDPGNYYSGSMYAWIAYNGVQDTNDMQRVENYLKCIAGIP